MPARPTKVAVRSMASEDRGGRYDGHPFRQVLDSAKPWIPPSLGFHQALDFLSHPSVSPAGGRHLKSVCIAKVAVAGARRLYFSARFEAPDGCSQAKKGRRGGSATAKWMSLSIALVSPRFRS
jgi:hypothetical protein